MYTFSENDIPIFPPNIASLNSFLNISYSSLTTVDFPLEPVTAIIGDFVNQYPNSISLIIGMLSFSISSMILFLCGFIPGLIITKSDFKHLFECEYSISIFLFKVFKLSIFLLLLKRTFAPR